MRKLVKLVFLFFVSGCATFTLTRTEALRFAHLSLRQFLRQRFVEAERRVYGEATREVTTLISGIFGTTNDAQVQDRPGLMQDGSVVYRAFFNHVSYDQLLRPSIELLRFCGAQGGTFQVVTISSHHYVAAWFAEHGDMGAGPERRAQAEMGYARALREGAFGSYQCLHPKADRPDWSATVEPYAFEPGPSDNLLISHELKIHIIPAP